jgi:hypothetical protein
LLSKAAPLSTDQLPDPTDGALPFMVKMVAHMGVLLPALAIVGKSSRVMDTVELEAGQTPLLIVHARTLLPTPKFVITALLLAALVNNAGPLTTDQDPAPTDGALPLNVNVVAQMVA